MDPIPILLLLSNLLENTVIPGQRTSHVFVSVCRVKNDAMISVRDDGCGISSEALPSLFDATVKQRTGFAGDGKRNMGIGLSVCKAIVKAHGGTMEARNLPDGAEFTFRLPLNH